MCCGFRVLFVVVCSVYVYVCFCVFVVLAVVVCICWFVFGAVRVGVNVLLVAVPLFVFSFFCLVMFVLCFVNGLFNVCLLLLLRCLLLVCVCF